jgi:hypothetical protein
MVLLAPLLLRSGAGPTERATGVYRAPRHWRHFGLRTAFNSASRLAQRRIRPAGSSRKQRQGSHDNALRSAFGSAGRWSARRPDRALYRSHQEVVACTCRAHDCDGTRRNAFPDCATGGSTVWRTCSDLASGIDASVRHLMAATMLPGAPPPRARLASRFPLHGPWAALSSRGRTPITLDTEAFGSRSDLLRV